MIYKCVILAIFIATVVSQQVGTNTAEVHPPLNFQTCTHSGGCQSNSGSVVLDANWRWTHNVGGYTNCYTGNTWDTTLCPDPVTCASNCAVDGADYEGTYGVSSDGTTLTIGFVTVGQYSTNIGSRLYLMASESEYQMFKLKNQEFSFDVDVSNLPCGLNGALYFVQMDADGGLSKYPGNKAGAAYGTGYCDGQCPHDLKFINGQANTIDWTADPNNKNAGTGFYGTCCNEMDVWEANQFSAAYTPHVCTVNGQYRCNGTQCGDSPNNRYNGVCDKDGCDFNSYRMGVENYIGKGMTVDTSQPFTVVTQWFTSDNTSSGELVEIRRLYVQNGKVIVNSAAHFPNLKPYDSITDEFCNDQKNLFGDKNSFEANGGLKAMGDSMEAGVVLVMSLWDDYTANMLWLDSSYPATGNVSQPGIARGPCATSSGVPSQVESEYPNSAVKYGNIRFGDIGSTYSE